MYRAEADPISQKLKFVAFGCHIDTEVSALFWTLLKEGFRKGLHMYDL